VKTLSEDGRQLCQSFIDNLCRHSFQQLRLTRDEIHSARLIAANHARGVRSGSFE